MCPLASRASDRARSDARLNGRSAVDRWHCCAINVRKDVNDELSIESSLGAVIEEDEEVDEDNNDEDTDEGMTLATPLSILPF